MKKNSDQESSIYDELLGHRVIFVDTEINEELHTEVVGRLLLLNQKDATKKKPIYILINSDGGYMTYAFGITDVIKSSHCPVYTICTGVAASAAAMILASGHKRYALPRSTIMIHCHWAGSADLTHHQMMVEAKESERIHKELINFFIETTNLPKRKVEFLLGDKDTWLSPIQAKELNIIDESNFDLFSIVSSNKKQL